MRISFTSLNGALASAARAWHFWTIAVIILLLAGACVPAPTPAPTPVPPTLAPAPTPVPPTPPPAADLVAPVNAFVAAINAGDVDAALALFTDKVKWDPFGNPVVGSEASRAVLDWLVALETRLQITSCQPQADRVTCDLTYVDGCGAPSGVPDGWPAKLVFVYQPDGKITQAIMSRGELPDDVWDFWGGLNAWMRANRAADLVHLYDADGEGGALFVKTCQEYAATLGK